MSSAASSAEERLLPQILAQLDEQGKKVKSSTVLDVNGQPHITVMLLNGEVRKYNEKGQLTEVRDPYGKITLYEDGMPIEERDANGGVMARYQYFRSVSGKMQKMVKRSAAGVVTKIFDDDGNPVQATDSQGTKVFTNYVKNEKGKTVGYTETDLATSKTNRMILDPKNGEVIARIDENNIRTDIETLYNQQGEKMQTIERDTAGNVTIKKFENEQMVEQVENGIKTTYENILNDKGVLVQKKEVKFIATNGGMIEEVTVKDYDDQGRVIRVKDKEGEHEYTYEVNLDGRITARHELLKPATGARAKEKVTYYDEAGRVIGLDEEGRKTKIVNVLDENGNIVSATEYITYDFNGKLFTDMVKKTFDGKGHLLSKIDQNGQRTDYSYDGKGNRIRSQVGDEITTYTYDGNNNMVSSFTQDYKSRTLTEYDQKTKLAERKILIKNSGVVEVTAYGLTQDGRRMNFTVTAFGVKTNICKDSESDQPEKTIFSKYNGKVIVTNYRYTGEHLVSSTEEGPMGATETRYNVGGKPLHSLQTDKWGRTQETDYRYEKGVLAESLMVDKKGRTSTYYNNHGDAEKIVRVNTIGFPRRADEERSYKDGILVRSVSRDVKGETVTDYDQNEQAAKVHRTNKHGFPRQNWVENIYDAGGDITESRQTDSRGYTVNKFDHDGLMTDSERVDIHGYPKRKQTAYDYINGELVSSITDDDRGTTFNSFDKDGLMRDSRRVKKFGFPREERTSYEYDGNAYMIYSKTEDENGTTQNWFNIDELVAVSFRKNLYGHARDQWTVNEYDGEGFLTTSKETDLRGSTVTEFNIDGLPIKSFRVDHYGVEYSRETLTVNEFDDQGFMTISKSKNLLTTVEKEMDKDALVQVQRQNDNYGVVFGRYKVTDEYVYDGHGRLQTNVTTDKLGQTTSKYDIHGDAVETLRIATIGLGASRESFTISTYHADTGMTTDRLSKSNYGTTHSTNFDAVTGLEQLQQINNNYGLGATRYTVNQVTLDRRHGLTRYTLATNEYGKTETHYDAEQNGAYGIAVSSRAITNYGLGFARDTASAIEADINTGLNQRTKAVNKYGTTITEYDSLIGGTYGVSISSVTENYFGLGATRQSRIQRGDLEVNLWNGLNKRTLSRSEYGTTETWYEDGQFGVARASDTNCNFGLGATRHSWIKEGNMEVNTFNGLNIRTFSESAFGTTETRYDDKTFGVAVSSDTKNNFGLGASRHSWVAAGNMEVNTDNGLNKRTLSESAYGKTETLYDDAQYGVAKSSDTNNNFGLGAARHSWISNGNMEVNTWNGLTKRTLSESAYGTVETQYEDTQYGVAKSSDTNNNFGLGATRHSWIAEGNMDVNTFNGLNIRTLSQSEYGTTETWYEEEQYGVAKSSDTKNNFGLGATRHSWIKEGNLEVNTFNGLNIRTLSESAYGITETWYEDGKYGVAKSSDTNNSFGLMATRHSWIKDGNMEVNNWNGLNIRTFSESEYGTTETWYEDAKYGVARASDTNNKFGLGATRHSWISDGNMEVNTWNGLNIRTFSESAYGTTETWYEDGKYGVAKASDTKNNFGLGASRHSWINEGNMDVNTWNGLNIRTFSESAYGTTETKYDDQKYGVAKSSDTNNNFGLGATRHSWIKEGNMEVNVFNGLNIRTLSESAYGNTETWYEEGQFGVAKASDTKNNFGLVATRHSWIKEGNMEVNTWNGLNIRTFSESAYGTTETRYDQDHYGVARSSDTNNNFGLGATRHSWIKDGNMEVNTWNGLNIRTLSESAYGTTETWYEDEQFGVAQASDTKNNFGLGATRHSWIKEGNMEVNTWNGLNIRTFSESAYGTTETWYEDGQYGVAKASDTKNNFGLGATRHSWIKEGNMEVNTFNGLNIRTFSESAYGTTETWYDDDKFGVAKASDTKNNFGLGATRHSWIKEGNMEVNTYNGLNIRTFSESAYGTTETKYDDKTFGVARSSDTNNNFGLIATRHSWIKDGNMEVNTWNGLNIRTFSESAYGTTETWYEDGQYGVAHSSDTHNNFGLGATQHSWIKKGNMQVNTWNGLNQHTFSESAYGTTETWYEDGQYGIAEASDTNNNFGLGATRHSWISKGKMEVNTYNGLNIRTFSESAYGTTETWYDDSQYGIAKASDTHNNFGLGATRHSQIKEGEMDIDPFNGLNKRTLSESAYGTTETWYEDETYGVAKASDTNNNFGLGATRHSWIEEGNMEVNTWNGLNQHTFSESAYGTTETWYDDKAYGVARSSDTNNNFGLGATRHSWIKDGNLEVNTWNGLNIRTFSESAYGTTETWYEDSQYGIATSSDTNNNFGLGATRHSWIKKGNMEVNTWNGLNIRTFSESAYGTTETWYDDKEFGVAKASDTKNNFGLGATRHSWIKEGNMEVNTFNGLNIRTFSESIYGTTETWYDDKEFGVAKASDTNNNFGLGATRHSWIKEGNIEVNTYNGLNIRTFSESAYGTTETWYSDDSYGVAERSHSLNNFGIGATRDTTTQIDANRWNGLNIYTQAKNEYGMTETWYTDDSYGVAKRSHSLNNYGLGASRDTTTEITTDTWDGLTEYTFARNAYGTTETWYKDDSYGVAERSHSLNNYGLGASRDTNTTIQVDTWNGLNEYTRAINAYGMTETWYTDDTYGIAERSHSVNNYGLGATRDSNTTIQASQWDGLNDYTFATNAYGTTETWFSDDSYGVAVRSHNLNNYGLGACRDTNTEIQADRWDGLNDYTYAVNVYGTTETWYSQDTYGVAERSHALNNYGIGASRDTTTDIQADRWDGLNEYTYAVNAYGMTETWFSDDTYGVAEQSHSLNNYGLGATRDTHTTIQADQWDGLNEYTFATNAYGTTETWFSDDTYGVAVRSHSLNNFGLGATRDTNTTITADRWDGLNEYTYAVNAYGMTETWYSDDTYGVAERSHALNNYGIGATRDTNTVIQAGRWDGLNDYTQGVNAYGMTETWYSNDTYGVAERSHALNNYGIGASRDTMTTISADRWDGLNEYTLATNDYGMTETWYSDDTYGVAVRSHALNNYGIGATRDNSTTIQADRWDGLNEYTFATNAYGTTETWYSEDTYGVAERSHSLNNYGLGATRDNRTTIQADRWDGLNEYTYATNAYGITETWYSDDTYGVAERSHALNNYGLGATRDTNTTITADRWNGMNDYTMSTNAYGMTETWYSQDTYGVAERSHAVNNYGIGATRDTNTTITADRWDGLNEYTLATNVYGMTETWYSEDTYGVAERSHAVNNYGIGATRDTNTTITADRWDGLNEFTFATNAYGTTETWYSADTYGVAERSHSLNNFGLGATRDTNTTITADRWDGLNEYTYASNAYGITETWYTDDTYGVAERSHSLNNFGIGATRDTNTTITADRWDGLNEYTNAVNAYGMTETWFSDDTYGVAERSHSVNNFGIGATRDTNTTVTADRWNGLNDYTIGINAYGVTETWYTQDSYGVSERTHTMNNYGIGATRDTNTQVTADTWNGLNIHTMANNAYGMTETWYARDTYGIPERSHSLNNFGLGATRDTNTTITADRWNGLNIGTFATNAYGTTETWFTRDSYGLAERSHSVNNFGLGATRDTNTAITADPWSGLNTYTNAVNAYGRTETWYSQDTYGVADHSRSQNNYGLGATRDTNTTITADRWDGLNDYTLAINAYGRTETWFTQDTYGVAQRSHSVNNYGVGASRDTNTTITADHWNGLNTYTNAINAYGRTETWYSQDTYGVATRSHSVNNFGLGATRDTNTTITADRWNGLNTNTVATNDYGRTETWFSQDSYGVATRSHSVNNYGLGATRDTNTTITADRWNGLNTNTVAVNDYGRTETWYSQDTYGVATRSHSVNNYGLGATRNTNTTITVDHWSGLNTHTVATNAYGTTETWYSQDTYGVATRSHSANNYGLGATRDTNTTITADRWNGLNVTTVATNAYGRTETWYSQDTYGVATRSHSVNHYGLGSTRDTNSTITADRWNGLNTNTIAINAYGTTETWYSQDTYGVAERSHSLNNYGLGASRDTNTTITASRWSGLNTNTVATNAYGTTETWYTQDTYGVAQRSHSVNNYGLGATRDSNTTVTVDRWSGLNTYTNAVSAYSTTETWYKQDTYGTAERSHSVNKFGLGATRDTNSTVTASNWNGLNQHTTGTNAYGTTDTWYSNDSYGVAVRSESQNNYGLGATRDASTTIAADRWNGLNTHTKGVTAYGTTDTWYSQDTYGVAERSHSVNKYGLGATRDTTTPTIQANRWNGLNEYTLANNAYSRTETWYSNDSYGLPERSHSVNNYGLGATRDSQTTITSNRWSGLNTYTTSTNNYGTTETWYTSDTYGVARRSHSVNNYGLGATRNTHTDVIDVDNWSGLNTYTHSFNNYGTTETWFKQDTFGTASRSHSVNNYGLGWTRDTSTTLVASNWSGLNLRSSAINMYGSTDTWYSNDSYGVAERSHSLNNVGLGYTRDTMTTIEVNRQNGLNVHSFANNRYGTTDTYYSNDSYGVAERSVAHNDWGVYGERDVRTTLTVNRQTGVNISTVAVTSHRTTTTYFDNSFGIATRSVSVTDFLPSLAQTTRTDITASQDTGLNFRTVAENGLSTTTTDAFDPDYGVAEHIMTYNKYCSGEGNRNVETTVDANLNTGLNQETYSRSFGGGGTLSETWTNYRNDTGTQTDAVTVMNANWTLGYSVNNQITYVANQTTGKLIQSTSVCSNGRTITNYDGHGLPKSSENYSAYGLSDHTSSTINYYTTTGMTKKSVARSYSRLGGHYLSTTTTDHDENGTAKTMVTDTAYGATRARVSTTTVSSTYSFTGAKKRTSTTTGLGSSISDFNQKGVEMYSDSHGNIGPSLGRHSETWTKDWDENTGIRRSKYTSSGLSHTWTFSDENGLPAAGLHKMNQNFYGSAAGSRYSEIYRTGAVHWSGNAAETRSLSPGHSTTMSQYDEDGFTTYAVTDSIYGANGMQHTDTTYQTDSSTGLTRSSHLIKCNGRGSTKNYFDSTYGCVSSSDDWDKDGNKTHTTYGFNHSTGMTTSTVSTGEGNYKESNTTYDEHGRKLSSRTQRDKQDGKKKKTEVYTSTFENNDWTGFKQTEWRVNVQNSQTKTIHYDRHGVEYKNWTQDYKYPTGEVINVVEYTGRDADGNPTDAIREVGGDRQTQTIREAGFVQAPGPDKYNYLPTQTQVTFHQANYITSATITYTVNSRGPVAATVVDNQGTESWTMDEGYENSAIFTRTRRNNGGSTISWNYTDNPEGPFHTSANVTYTDYMGVHTGSGTETYTTTGILSRKVMTNSDTMNQTLTYQNDGQYVTTATGVREDGVSVSYAFTGVNEFASFQDDKGITTWNPASQKMLTSAGGVGTFNYTYSGDRVTKIEGTSARDGQMSMDKWWNVKTWTDSKGVVHTYTGTATNKGYWTKANETFTDKGGGKWQGTMNYDNFGFYFKGGELKGTKAKVDATGAVNTVDMDDAKATDSIKTMLKKYNTQKETWTWTAPDDVGKRTLGDWQAAYMNSGDLTQLADVSITIAEDGSTQSIFSNIRFNKSNFTQKNRFKPTSSSHSWTTISDSAPSTYDTRNDTKKNDKFFSGHWGDRQVITGSETVQVGTTTVKKTRKVTVCDEEDEEGNCTASHEEDEEYEEEEPVYSTKWYVTTTSYDKESDGWMWVSAGSKSEQFYADTMTQNTGTIIAGGAGSKSQVSGSSMMVYRFSHGNKAGGVLLAGGMEGQQEQSGKARSEQTETVAPQTETEVTAAAVEKTETETTAKARGEVATVTEAKTEETAEAAKSKDNLQAAFAGIKSLADVADFLKLAMAKFSQEAVAAGLKNSGAAQLLEQLVQASRLVFGDAAKESVLGKLTTLLLNNQQMVEEVRLAITGGELVSDDVKQAVKIAENMKYADVVSRDEKGRVIEAVDHNGGVHTFKYEAEGFTETVKDSSGRMQVAQYDQAGRLVAVNEGGTNRTYAYADGKTVVTERTQSGEVTMEYGSDGRLISLEADGQKTTFQYSGQGTGSYTAIVVGQNGKALEQKTYRDGRLVAKMLKDGTKVSYDYQISDAGEVQSVTRLETDAKGNQTVMKFDKNGRLISVKDKSGEKKMAEAEEMSGKALEFVEFELFGDPRVDSMRIDNKVLQGFEQK
ncbi:MAG: hypothetical protein AB1439_11010 [candidate division FCPU426 bacterium]